MSSSFSIFTARAKESIGLSKRSEDPDVDNAATKLALLERDVGLLKKTLQTAADVLTSAAPRARAGMVEIMSALGEFLVRDGAHFDVFARTHAELDGPSSGKLADAFAKAVIAPLDEWIATFPDLKRELGDLDKARVVFDHYRQKYAALLEEKRVTQAKGKVTDKAFEEKVARNAEKLKEVRARGGPGRARGAGDFAMRACVRARSRAPLTLPSPPSPARPPRRARRARRRTRTSATRRSASCCSRSRSRRTGSTRSSSA